MKMALARWKIPSSMQSIPKQRVQKAKNNMLLYLSRTFSARQRLDEFSKKSWSTFTNEAAKRWSFHCDRNYKDFKTTAVSTIVDLFLFSRDR